MARARQGAAPTADQKKLCRPSSPPPFPPTPPNFQVDGALVSSIGRGLLILVGIAPEDGPADVDWLARKVLSTRLWPSADGRPWALAAPDAGADLLFVSQFTLHASVRKGTKPDFSRAAPPDVARATYGALLDRVREAYEPDRVKDGVFGAMMQVRRKRWGGRGGGGDTGLLGGVDISRTSFFPPPPPGLPRQRRSRHPDHRLKGRSHAPLQGVRGKKLRKHLLYR